MRVPLSGTGGTGGTQGPAGTGGIAGTGTPAGTGGTGVPAGTGGIGGTGGGSTGAVFDAGTDPNRNAVVAGTICERLAAIQCAGEAYCCPGRGRDVNACKQVQQSACDSMTMADDVADNPVTAFDPAAAMTVFTELERLASLCDPMIAAYGESFAGLRSLFTGTKEADESCRPSNPLDKSMAAAALAACTDAQNQACLPGLVSWRCVPHASAGGACFSDVNCDPGLYCDNPNYQLSGSDCMPRKAVGASCDQPNECQSLYCIGGMCVAADVQAVYCLD